MSLQREPSAPSASVLREQRVRLEVEFAQLMALVPNAAELPPLDRIAALGLSSARLWSAVADLLDLLDRELGSEGSGTEKATLSAADARAVLDEGSRAQSPGNWQSCLAAGYAKLNECASDQHWAHWQNLVHLWTKVAYLGGTHRSGGLAARLMTSPLLTDRRTAPRMTPPYYRWDRRDIAELRELSQSARLLAAAIVK